MKDGNWRLAIVDSGFNGGLGDVLRMYGGEESEEDDSSLANGNNTDSDINNTVDEHNENISSENEKDSNEDYNKKVYLEKKKKVEKIVLEKAPHLIDLTKKVTITLEKKKMQDVTAAVVVVLDRSGSMNSQYKRGDVQRAMDKLLPIALMFDDDGSLDTWTFACEAQNLSSINLDNIKDYIKTEKGGWSKWTVGGVNNEPSVMRKLIKKYKKSKQPVYIIFISDGGIRKKSEIKQLMKKSSGYPMFWQFVGLGGSNYGILEEFDTMEGRLVDNVNFFEIDTIDSLTDEQLYDKLLNEFPLWLKEAKKKGIVK